MDLGPRVRITTVVAVFLLVVALGPLAHHGWNVRSMFGLGGTSPAPYNDMGWFVVSNSYPANGTSAPRPLVGGHWGWELNFTRPVLLNMTFYESWGLANQTLDFRVVNLNLASPTLVYLDLGKSSLASPCYLDVAWVG